MSSTSLKPSEVCSVFVNTSFVNVSTMLCCLTGLTINFLTAFAWGILTKWLKTWGNGDLWSPLPSELVANIAFFYAIPKGCLQFISGFVSDLIGRRYTIGVGLFICSASLFAMTIVGNSIADQDSLYTSFCVCAFILGTGTAIM